MTKLGKPLQGRRDTFRGRYPAALARMQTLLPDASRVLCFGCSTGEECLDLADAFPTALITGVDVSPAALATARERNSHSRVRYVDPADIDGGAPYSLITAHSVLCHHPQARNMTINKLWSFNDFADTVEGLDALLAVGGLLSIINAEYEFAATRLCSVRYDVDSARMVPSVRVFDARNTTTRRGDKPLPYLFRKVQW